MIRTENGNIHVKGDICEIKADLSFIVHELYNNVLTKEMTKEEAKEEILEAIEVGFKDLEEVKNDALDAIMKVLEEMTELLKKGKGEK